MLTQQAPGDAALGGHVGREPQRLVPMVGKTEVEAVPRQVVDRLERTWNEEVGSVTDGIVHRVNELVLIHARPVPHRHVGVRDVEDSSFVSKIHVDGTGIGEARPGSRQVDASYRESG